MKDPKKLIPDDRALLYLRGCNPYQFVDRVTKIVRDCIDQIQEFFNVLETIHDGKDGKDGDTPYIKDNYWYIGDINTNILAKGETGPAGPMGPMGLTGPIGPSGPEGPKGLTGEKGDKGETGPQGATGATGPQGPAGQDGHDGVNGVDGADGADGADGITPHIDSTTGNWFIGEEDTGIHAQGPQGEPGITPDISGKADKVQNATNGNLAGLDGNGNLVDSNIKASDVIQKSNTAGLVKNDGSVDTTPYASVTFIYW